MKGVDEWRGWVKWVKGIGSVERTEASTFAGEDVLGALKSEMMLRRMVVTVWVGNQRSSGSSPLISSTPGGWRIDIHTFPSGYTMQRLALSCYCAQGITVQTIRMPEIRYECNSGRAHRVISGELHHQLKDSSFTGVCKRNHTTRKYNILKRILECFRGSLNVYTPLMQIIVTEFNSNAFYGLWLELYIPLLAYSQHTLHPFAHTFVLILQQLSRCRRHSFKSRQLEYKEWSI